MRTVRLLLWLRWRTLVNALGPRGRVVTLVGTAFLLLALAPVYLGGAMVAVAVAKRGGHDVLVPLFGIVQFAIGWFTLLSGALGRTFELDRLQRYPLRPATVFLTNTLTAASEPVVLLSLPALIGGVVGVGLHEGAAAGALAAVAAVLLLFVTLAWLQWLLALLDDLLRREWLRYVAALLFTGTVIGAQVLVRRGMSVLRERTAAAGYAPDDVGGLLRDLFGALPSVAAPASVAGAVHDGPLASPWIGLAVTAALIVAPVVLGTRAMATSARRPTATTPSGQGRARSLSLPIPGLTRIQGLLLGRELIYLLRTPTLVFQWVSLPLVALALWRLQASDPTSLRGPWLPLTMLAAGLVGRNLVMWGHDGAGLRMLFLEPLAARDLVLSKNLAWLLTTLAEGAVVFGGVWAIEGSRATPLLVTVVPGYLAVVLVAAVGGTAISILHPIRPRERGLGRRGPGGLTSVFALLGLVVVLGAIVLMVLGVRMLLPERWDVLGSTLVTTGALLVALPVWWVSLERFATLIEARREAMVDAIAKATEV